MALTIHLVPPADLRAARNVSTVARMRFGDSARTLDMEAVDLEPASSSGLEEFKDTPQPLLDSWTAHQRLMAATQPGDTVIISDWCGLGGVFALTQWSLPADQRRVVITVAADSACLHWLAAGGTIDDLPMPLASQIDWEIVQYQWSNEVLSPSEQALHLLESGVVRGRLVPSPEEPSEPVSDPAVIWAPEPVGRRSRTGEILRAMASLSEGRLLVSTEDEADEVWTGTSWDALRHSRAVLGERLKRSPRPDRPTAIVLGDPFSVPEEHVADLVAQGVPVIVPHQSAAARRWPTAPTWNDADDLAAVLLGSDSPRSASSVPAAAPRTPAPDRATRISVGVPVFRDVRFLDECVTSILEQEVEPVEVFLIDDGSASEEVDEALEAARAMDSRIRILAGEHRGVCVSRNRALEAMTGDAFLFVDSDDVLEPRFLARTREMLRTDEQLLAIATWTRFFGAYEGIEAKPPFDVRVGTRENPIVSTAALVDMRVRELDVRFAPDLAFLYCEDWHFWSQIAAAGGRFGLIPEALIRHRVHQGSGGFMRTDLALAIGRSRAVQPLRR